MNNAVQYIPSVGEQRTELARRITELRPRAARPTEETLRQYLRLDADFQALADDARNRLLGTALAWSDGNRREAAWLRRTTDDLAVLGFNLCESAAARLGEDDGVTQAVMARTLLNMGNVVKWEVAVTREAPHDFAKAHAILRSASAAGRHRVALRTRFDGRDIECTLESLYFRALLLARLSGGALNMKQIEILDAWMWMWMPVLKGVEAAPSDVALRADLDSAEGLRRGPRPDAGPSLYLAPDPIEKTYRSIVREFQDGHMVPADGIASTFRVEEHIAVLDLIGRGLRASTHAQITRAERREASVAVELHVGLAELTQRGFSPAPPPPPTLTLAALDGHRMDGPRLERERDLATDSVYDRKCRTVRVANTSETGFGIEGDEATCREIAVGDVVALRLLPEAALEICTVVRSAPSPSGKTWLGLRRLSAKARPIDVVEPSATSGREQTLVFVPGEDESGRHDACLVSERAFAAGAPFEAFIGDCVYTFRFNRARRHGRGWVLAGFEIVSAKGENDIELAWQATPGPSSLHVLPAVDRDVGPGQEGGLFRGEVGA